MPNCSHLTVSAHKSGKDWRCSGCGKVAKWGPTWQWFGAIECKKCGAEPIEFVACSDACVDMAQSQKPDLKKRQVVERRRLELQQIDEQMAALQERRSILESSSKR